MVSTRIKESLEKQGVCLTLYRRILLALIDGSGNHLDAETLFHLAQEKDPRPNRVTVCCGGDRHYYETQLKQELADGICLRCDTHKQNAGVATQY